MEALESCRDACYTEAVILEMRVKEKQEVGKKRNKRSSSTNKAGKAGIADCKEGKVKHDVTAEDGYRMSEP